MKLTLQLFHFLQKKSEMMHKMVIFMETESKAESLG